MSVDGFWGKHWNRTMDFFLHKIVIIFHLFSLAEQTTFSILFPVDTTKIHLALIMGTDPSDGRLWKWCSPKVTKAIFWGHMFFQKCSFFSSRLRNDFPLHLNRPETKKCTLGWGHGDLDFISFVFLSSLSLSSYCVSPAPHYVCACACVCVYTCAHACAVFPFCGVCLSVYIYLCFSVSVRIFSL